MSPGPLASTRTVDTLLTSTFTPSASLVVVPGRTAGAVLMATKGVWVSTGGNSTDSTGSESAGLLTAVGSVDALVPVEAVGAVGDVEAVGDGAGSLQAAARRSRTIIGPGSRHRRIGKPRKSTRTMKNLPLVTTAGTPERAGPTASHSSVIRGPGR
jgi:hypothetical protein